MAAAEKTFVDSSCLVMSSCRAANHVAIAAE